MIRWLIGGVVALVLVLSFLTTRVVDDLAPAGATDVITVWDQPTSTRGSFQTLVEATAEAHDMTVLKEVRSESGEAVVRHEYVVNPSAVRAFRLSEGDTHGFDAELVTRFRPVSDLPDNQVNGTYLTDAGSAAADRFAASMRDAGITVTVDPLSPVAVLLWTASEVPVIPLGVSALLVVVIGVTSWQASRRRRASIAAAFGRARASSSLRDAGRLTAMTVGGGGTAALGVGVALALLDQGARLRLFLGITVTGLACAAVAVAVVALATAACTSRPLLRSIDGARPLRSVLVVSLVCNVLVLALASSTSTSAWRIVDLSLHDTAEQDRWRPALDDVRLTFSTSEAELDAAEPELAELFARSEESGTVVLADHVVAPNPSSHDPDEGNVLLVNAQYLREQRVLARSGEPITPEALDRAALTLLVPEGVRVGEEDRRAWHDFLAFQRQTSTDPTSIPRDIDVDTLATASHEVFDYATDDLWSTSTTHDTVIAVLPSAAPSLSEDRIVSAMTTGEVVFTDPTQLRALLTEHHASVAMVEPLRDAVSYRSTVIERALRLQLAALGVLVVVLAVAADVTARALVESRLRRTTILRIHSRSAARTTSATLAPTLVVLTAAGTAVVTVMAGPDRPAAAACALLDVLLVVLATARLGLRRYGADLDRR